MHNNSSYIQYPSMKALATIPVWRAVLLCTLSGTLWYLCFMLFFVWSGAQSILANPAYQSAKFLGVFTDIEPLPRMYGDTYLLLKGAYLISLLWAILFLLLQTRFSGGWLSKGARFGTLLWVVMVPWFEFYLPYNVMHEPLPLVLFEALLWLCTLISTGLLFSFILNFRRV